MGIKGLNTLLKKYAPEAITNTNLEEFKGNSVAIDVSIFAYKFLYNNGNIFYKFLQQISILLKNNIHPIYIFDGKPPVQKKEVLISRKEIREKKIEQKNKIIEKLKNPDITDIEFFRLQDEKDKIEKTLIYITPEIYKSLKEMFDLLSINYIQAPEEADTVCCQLYKDKIVNASISEDFDLLLRGSGILIRNFDLFNNEIVTYNLQSILKKLDINYSQFIDLAILCGCDYTSKINGIGPVNALKLIRKYNDIENIINLHCKNKKYKNISIPADFDYLKARNMMKVPENEFKDYKISMRCVNTQSKVIENWFFKNTSVSKKTLKNLLKNILPREKPKNNTIDKYFSTK